MNKNLTKFPIYLLAVFASTFFLTSLCIAQDEAQLERDSIYVYDNTMSPYCPGRTLGACPSEDARLLREEIRGMLKAGYSRQAVVNQMQMRYGFEVRGVPATSGFGIVAWILPLIFVLLGLLLVAVFLRSSKNSSLPVTETNNTQSENENL